jgi:hypothetical protein
LQIVKRNDDQLILTDDKTAIWSRLTGIALTVGMAIAMILGIKYLETKMELVTVLILGTVFLILGIGILLKESFASTVTIDRRLRTLNFRQSDLFRNKDLTFPADDIKRVEVIDTGMEHNSWEIEFTMTDGSTMPLSVVGMHSRKSDADDERELIASYLTPTS